jgi:CBS-domain-containing membrane protein
VPEARAHHPEPPLTLHLPGTPLVNVAQSPPTPAERRYRPMLVAWLGTFLVISATWSMFSAQQMVYAFASLGGSCVIVFGMPDSPMAQPRSLCGGHALASAVGLVFLLLFGRGPWALAAAVATALVLMQLTRTIHSPAGADAIIVMSGGIAWTTVVLHLAIGLLLLWVVALVLLNGFGIREYGRGVPGVDRLVAGLDARRSAARRTRQPG